MKNLTSEDIKNAVEILKKGSEKATNGFFLYCEYHKDVHLFPTKDKECFERKVCNYK